MDQIRETKRLKGRLWESEFRAKAQDVLFLQGGVVGGVLRGPAVHGGVEAGAVVLLQVPVLYGGVACQDQWDPILVGR